MEAKHESTDGISREQAGRIQEQERQGRDAGADSYLERLRVSRGAFRMRVEDLAVPHAVAPRPDHHVLDAGAGVGRYALMLAPRVKQLTAVDFSAGSIAVLARHAAERSLGNLNAVVGDLTQLPADLGTFHTAYSCEVFQHIPTPESRLAALKQIVSHLHPGGRCIVTSLAWNRRTRGEKEGLWANGAYRFHFAPAEIAALFREAGLQQVSVHGLVVLPGVVSRHLPASFAALDAWMSRMPGTGELGAFVLATGIKPAQRA
jgi:2-polyprenyl-3-methyl-5-hydroxy-6-metoxy-1,4-benzoquinol methylase